MKITTKFLTLTITIFLLITLFSTARTVNAYTPCVGVESGDTVNIHYELMVGSPGASPYQSTYGGEPFITEVTTDKLIQGFYEGLLGMKISDRKDIEVPPSKGYTDENHELYGEWLYFDVVLNDVPEGYNERCDVNSGSFGTTLLKIFGWIGGIILVGFIGISGYLQFQKTSTPACAHCQSKNMKTLSDGKCGKCGSNYCRKSFARGCPNCGSNTFIPHKKRLD